MKSFFVPLPHWFHGILASTLYIHHSVVYCTALIDFTKLPILAIYSATLSKSTAQAPHLAQTSVNRNHSMEKREIYSNLKSISWKWLTYKVIYIVIKSFLSRNFCGNGKSKFPQFQYSGNLGEKIPWNWLSNSDLLGFEKWKICSHQQNISSNQLFSKSFTFTKFLSKMRESKFP